MSIIGIVAIDENGAIGKGGRVPWHFPADLKFFKQQTIKNACVMGRKTWLTLKAPLVDRLNIVLSGSSEIEPRNSVVLTHDPISVLSLVPYLSCDLYVIGGAQVYRAFLPAIEKWFVTKVPVTVEGADTFMPAHFLNDFDQHDSSNLGDGLTVVTYRRRKAGGDRGF